jgi:hypothetical protein
MTLQEAKDMVAQKYGYNAWELGENAMLTHISNEELIYIRLEQAAELYAEAKARKAWNNAIDAAAEAAEVVEEPDYQGGSYAVVKKQSILNLKK